eukprot:TRINITY_DN2774_c0_g1_i3.p1 TRINITY_DN2774_c0_g1~~TRINITY_DN2774_c0_g1_i3.p1  ORF type:complete len:300 (+),score=37.67 TRINITY_DN2774_c0_g1_i3:718-1617(+)
MAEERDPETRGLLEPEPLDDEPQDSGFSAIAAPTAPPGLEFQDFGRSGDVPTDGTIQPISEPPPSANFLDADAAAAAQEEENASFYELAYYRPFFNVETTAVLKRLALSFWPFRTSFVTDMADKPDLYGPFWIATTLIFLMAALSNFASWISFVPAEILDATTHVPTGLNTTWNYDFTTVTVAAPLIYAYVGLVPLMFYLAMSHADAPVTFPQVCSVYGYGLMPFVPAQLLCLIPSGIARFVAVGVGCALSLCFISANMYRVLVDSLGKRSLVLAILALVLHVALAAVMRFYFFQFADV